MTPVNQDQVAFEDRLLQGEETVDDPTLNFLTEKWRTARAEYDVQNNNIKQGRMQLTDMERRLLILEGATNSRMEDVREWARKQGVGPSKKDDPLTEEDEERDHA